MINGKQGIGTLTHPIEKANLEKVIVKQLTKLLSDDLSADLLENCKACENTETNTANIYFLFNDRHYIADNGFTVDDDYIQVTSNKHIYCKWKESYSSNLLYTLNIRTNEKWFKLRDKDTVIKDIFTALLKSVSFEQLILINLILIKQKYYNPIASMWVFQQCFYDTAYRYDNDAYQLITRFCMVNITEYCDFILINQKQLPLYFAKDTTELKAIINRILNNGYLDLTNVKHKEVVNNIFNWSKQFDVIDDVIIDFLTYKGKSYKCVLNLKYFSALANYLKVRPSVLDEAKGNIFPFIFKINSKAEIEHFIDFLVVNSSYISICENIIENSQAQIVTSGYKTVLTDWLKTANKHPDSKICQNILYIITKVFNYKE